MAFNNPLTALFGGMAQQPAAAPVAQPAGAPPAGTPAAGSNIPAFQQSTTEPPKPPTPLADYADLYNTPAVVDGQAPLTIADPYITLDNEAVRKTVATMNFAQGAQLQEQMGKALGGDVQALMSVLNAVGQNVYAQVASMSAVVADKAAREGITRLHDQIPTMVRSASTTNSLSTLNPLYDNPSIKPLADMARSGFETKNPTATPAQITEMVNKYITDVAKAFNPAAPASTNENRALVQGATTDFGGFFGPQ